MIGTLSSHFLLTIDVEDWFQVENLRPWNPPSTWGSRDSRVEVNVQRLLDLFDDIFQSPSTKKVHCTFFVLGWVAERMPHLVHEIAARGHEVASHGSSHRMCDRLSDAELRNEVVDSKHLLEDIVGQEVIGFRAPNFSIDDRVLSILQASGYRYDSSYNNFALHGRYGKIHLNGIREGIACRLSDDFFELPLSNLSIHQHQGFRPSASRIKHTVESGFVLPWSGGAYFRLIPLKIFAMGVRSILSAVKAYVFYLHPWEIDPGQPRFRGPGWGRRFRH
jgi:polysaccharide deacetylase family protein (PEP-CTERM system associated)